MHKQVVSPKKSPKLTKAHSPNSKTQRKTQEDLEDGSKGTDVRAKPRKSPKKDRGDHSPQPLCRCGGSDKYSQCKNHVALSNEIMTFCRNPRFFIMHRLGLAH